MPLDFTDLLATLAATAVGGIIALAGSYWLFRREQKVGYNARLDEALAHVIREAGSLYDDRSSRHVGFFVSTPVVTDARTAAAAASLRPKPSEALRTALQVAQLTARGDDRAAIKQLRKLADLADDRSLSSVLVDLRDIILDWRSETQAAAHVTDHVKALVALRLVDKSE